MPIPSNNSADIDMTAFHEAMQGVQRIYPDKIRLNRKNILKNTEDRSHLERLNTPIQDTSCLLHDFKQNEANYLPQVDRNTLLSFKKKNLSHTIFSQLRRGEYPIEARLDFHGLSIQQAHHTIQHALDDYRRSGLQMILIIHGKGPPHTVPVLKNKLNHWLRELSIVLAFCSATAAHGGSGAAYVLLKTVPHL